MGGRRSVIDEDLDPNDALAQWVGRRYGAHSEYLKIINLRENELLEASGKVGPRSTPFRPPGPIWRRPRSSATAYRAYCAGR